MACQSQSGSAGEHWFVQQGRWLGCCMLALQPNMAMVLAAGICQTEEVKAEAVAAEPRAALQLMVQHCTSCESTAQLVRAVTSSVLAVQDCQDDSCVDL